MRKYLIALTTAFVTILSLSPAVFAANSSQMSEGTTSTCGDWGFGTLNDCE
jgi:hypothetical protein